MSTKHLSKVLVSLMEGNKEDATKHLKTYFETKSRRIVERLESVVYTAPSYWASYFVNDDPSGMEDDEIEAADGWIESIGLGAPVDVEDVGFMSHHDAWEFSPLAGDCSEYTFFKREADVNDDMPLKQLGDDE